MLCVCVCRCVVAYLNSFRCCSTSRYGYQVNFGCNFVYVYDSAIMSFLLFLVIGNGRPLFRNFGHTFVCMRERVGASMHAQACVCMRRSVFCNRSSSGFRYLIDIIRACGCVRARVRADACVYVYISAYKKGPGMSPLSF